MRDEQLPTVGSTWREAGRVYWEQSRRPLASLALVLPLLVLCEGGLLLLGPRAVRNGADVWLRRLLDWIGLGQYFLLPAFTIGLLLAWHHLKRDRWSVPPGVLYVMLGECALLAFVLLLAARGQSWLLHDVLKSGNSDVASTALIPMAEAPLAGRLLGFAGAGVYEEMLFRLMLLPSVAGMAKRLGGIRHWPLIGAVLLTSVLFSAAHYLGPQGEALAAFSFAFRFLAGMFFAALFVWRGFGIAAGTHALYDVFVCLA